MNGEVIDGRYRILQRLGAGGMGAVYEAEHVGTGRRVAVKLIVDADLAKHDVIIQRFQREARAAGAIETQHIVQVFDTGTDPVRNLPYMVMELLRGGDLQALLKHLGPLPPDLALRLVAQACLGLSKAHEAGVIHRDIKPANIFLAKREDGELVVKLLDFGIAKVWGSAAGGVDSGLTGTGHMLGSPRYMSPEQAVGSKTIDHRTDIWSLGVVLYEMLAGRPMHAQHENLGALIMMICTQDPAPIQTVAPWVTPELAAVVHGALVRDVHGRFPSAAAMLDALRRLLPAGAGLREEMLVPLPAGLRATAPPRPADATLELPTTPAPIPSRSGGMTAPMTSGTPASSGSNPAGPIPPTFGARPANVEDPSGVAASSDARPAGAPVAAAPRPPWRVAVLVAGALACAGAAGVLALRARPGPPGVAVADTATVSQPREAPSVIPAPRTARLAIDPRDASVKVDGRPVPVIDGFVELTGTLGSTHHLVVEQGDRAAPFEVAITESGTMPSGVRLPEPAPSAKSASTAKVSAPRPAPAAEQPATTKPAPPPPPPAPKPRPSSEGASTFE